jgi:ABC-2 type transport system ATP-binding protein
MTTTIRSQVAIRASGLGKSFGGQVVLDGVDLEVPEGTVSAPLGPNGKTTTVHILTTLVGADAGQVRATIGVTGQLSAVDNLLTGEENLLLLADLRHLGRGEGRRHGAGLLEGFDLAAAAHKPAASWSPAGSACS